MWSLEQLQFLATVLVAIAENILKQEAASASFKVWIHGRDIILAVRTGESIPQVGFVARGVSIAPQSNGETNPEKGWVTISHITPFMLNSVFCDIIMPPKGRNPFEEPRADWREALEEAFAILMEEWRKAKEEKK